MRECPECGMIGGHVPSCRIMYRVPNQPRTPIRSVRIADELWEEAQAIAEDRGETVSDEIRAALERYVKRNRKEPGA